MITLNIFANIWNSINEWLKTTLKFDEFFMELFETHVSPITELFKWLLLLLLVIIIILGSISLIKKTFKLFIAIAVIVLLIALFV